MGNALILDSNLATNALPISISVPNANASAWIRYRKIPRKPTALAVKFGSPYQKKKSYVKAMLKVPRGKATL
jgi:hypothetical protein